MGNILGADLTRKPDHPVDVRRTLFWMLGVVAASTLFLSQVKGYGTVLFMAIGLAAWGIVAAATSHKFADQQDVVMWTVAGVLNVGLFSVPATVLYFGLSQSAPQLCRGMLIGWTILYMACLFVLFPATDGP